jgi:pSer/pThr/pTyr-binding forkhead associated (FHA) protein
MRIDVFVSYSTRNKPAADALCATLEQNGIRCWFAPRDIMPGRDWSGAIIDAITDCAIVVLIFSADSNNSEQVKREVATAVAEGKPIIPFRIEDVPLSKHMRYFIGTPHWLDALTEPMERHLEYLTRTVRSLLEVRDDESESRRTSAVAVPEAVVPTAQHAQDVAAGAESAEGVQRQQRTRLTMRIDQEGHTRHICLLAQPIVTLGKDRSNDIVLRVLPRSAAHDTQSAQISRKHAELRFAGEQVEWVNLACRNGTLIDGQRLASHTTTIIHDGAELAPGCVLRLACDLYRDSERQLAMPQLPGADAETRGDSQANGQVLAIRLRRLDQLAGLEQYVVFESHVSIGSGHSCAVLIRDDSVASHHAELYHSANGFQLEARAELAETFVDDRRLEVGDRVPIEPENVIRVGHVVIQLSEHCQKYLDS